ncbi:hypothetical protein E0494_10665 [Marinilabiliaceae bacterium JC040]|nr:hypothetical protein [Marinilabiliaceae bacterium JC040]
MNFRTFKAEYKELTFKIEEDYPEVGVYFYVYKEGKCIKDMVQDTIDTCMEIAIKEYGVPIDFWIEN